VKQHYERILMATALAVGMVATVGSASAQYSGVGISVSNTCASLATQAEFTACDTPSTPTVTFSASGLDFSSYGNISNTGNPTADYTVGSFLNSLGYASGITYSNGLTSGATANQMLYEFTGTALFTNGETYTIAHDDGATLVVNGVTVLSASSPTPPTTSTFTYTGTTGTYNFNFAYGECCSAPGVFETTLVQASTPEPSGVLLLVTSLIGAGVILRRKLA
jgi:hypothetical protein